MAEATRVRGFSYFGVADHSQSAHYAGGLSLEDIAGPKKNLSSDPERPAFALPQVCLASQLPRLEGRHFCDPSECCTLARARMC
jgi:hypothetical protein